MPEDLDNHHALVSNRRRFPATATTRLKQHEAAELRAAADQLDVSVSTLLRRLTIAYLREAA